MYAIHNRDTAQAKPADPFNKENAGEVQETERYFSVSSAKPTVGYVAWLYGWKVGDKEVRVVRHGEIPETPFEENGWKLMRPEDYSGVVSQEALDRMEILLREGVAIKAILIADDVRHHRPSSIKRTQRWVKDQVNRIDWVKTRNTVGKGIALLASTAFALVLAIGKKTRQKAEEINWAEVKSVTWNATKVVGAVVACIAVASVALPLLALAAVPAALFSLDPWLIVIDSEDRFWVVAEWFD